MILQVQFGEFSLAVLLGLNVAKAFHNCLPNLKPALFETLYVDRCLVLVFPHPSGIRCQPTASFGL